MLWAILTLGGIGLFFSLALGVFAKKFAVEVDPRIEQIAELLPNANCGACGYPGCSGYARAMVEQGVPCDLCPAVSEENAQKIAEILGVELKLGEKKVAVVRCGGTNDTAKIRFNYLGIEDCRSAQLFQAGSGFKACPYGCLGLGSCQRACPFDAIIMFNGVAVVNTEKCTGCGKCVEVCPRGIIELVPKSAVQVVLCMSQLKGAQTKKVCAVGCIACGVCAKRSKEDAIKMEGNLPKIDYSAPRENFAPADVCPQFTILDLRAYPQPLIWLAQGREELKRKKKEEKKKKAEKKQAQTSSGDKAQ